MIYLYCTITWQAVPFQRLEFELFFLQPHLTLVHFALFIFLFFSSNSAERVSYDALVIHFYLGVVCGGVGQVPVITKNICYAVHIFLRRGYERGSIKENEDNAGIRINSFGIGNSWPVIIVIIAV